MQKARGKTPSQLLAEERAALATALAKVGASTVEDLVQRHIRLLHKLNEKDKPPGFESWEDYHKHIVKLLDTSLQQHKLIQHIFIHSSYADCGFMKMTTEQKQLFVDTIKHDHPEAAQRLSRFIHPEQGAQ